MWWSKAAEHVTTFEEDSRWINTFMSRVGANVEAHSLPSGLKGKELRVAISEKLNNTRALFDIVIVDAMHRETLTEMAFELVSEDGMVMVDNSEGYDTYEITKAKKYLRIDFIGPANGVSSQHATSLFFKGNCPYLSCQHPIRWD